MLKSVIDMFIGNSDTSLLLFLKCHIYLPVNSDGMFKYFQKVMMTDVPYFSKNT